MSKLMLSKAFLGLFLILGLCVAGWWVLRDSGKPSPLDPLSLYAAPDDYDPQYAHIESELFDGNYAEAHGWLNTPGHVLYAGDASRVIQLIDDLYHDGAPQVWFVGMEPLEEENGLAATTLVVRMPSDPPTRARLFKREATFWGVADPTPDTGQKYLVFYFD